MYLGNSKNIPLFEFLSWKKLLAKHNGFHLTVKQIPKGRWQLTKIENINIIIETVILRKSLTEANTIRIQ